jgi:TP901-1 family phage major tail protein
LIPDLGTYTGSFMIASMEFAGEFNGEATYSFTFESASYVTFAAV